MTKPAKAATVATLALLSAFALIYVLRTNIPVHLHAGIHPMPAMWSEMGWLMALGPVAGLLFLGSMVTFVTLFVHWLSGYVK